MWYACKYTSKKDSMHLIYIQSNNLYLPRIHAFQSLLIFKIHLFIKTYT